MSLLPVHLEDPAANFDFFVAVVAYASLRNVDCNSRVSYGALMARMKTVKFILQSFNIPMGYHAVTLLADVFSTGAADDIDPERLCSMSIGGELRAGYRAPMPNPAPSTWQNFPNSHHIGNLKMQEALHKPLV